MYVLLVYVSIESLKAVHAIARRQKSYVLTDITKEIIKYINVIEEIEQDKLSYKLREVIRADKALTKQEKQSIIADLDLQ